MFDIGFSEMVLLAAIALIAIGPKQLPEVARTVGRLLNDLKRATGELTKTVVDARDITNKLANDVTSSFNDAAHSINQQLIPPQPIQTGVHQEPEPTLTEPHHDPFAHHDPHAHLELPSDEPKEEQLSLLDQPDLKKKDS